MSGPTAPVVLSRRWWARTLAINAGIVLLAFGAIQLVPVDRTNPPVSREPIWDAVETRALAEAACFDCHSHQTRWPWYARVAPASWLLWYDVVEGREALNFSDWDPFAAPEADPDDPFPPRPLTERIVDEIRSGRMPPASYRLMHPAARLSSTEQEILIDGLLRTITLSRAQPGD